jgi:serine/threonine protein kinase
LAVPAIVASSEQPKSKPFSFVGSLVKNAVKHLGDRLLGGGLVPFGSIAVGVYEEWTQSNQCANDAIPSQSAQTSILMELEKIAQDHRAFRKRVEEILAEIRPSPGKERQVMAYLSQVPNRIQASMRRPQDPTGRTIPPGFLLRKADDLKTFLPEKMPRFKSGDKPLPGTDLELLELLGMGGFGEVWKAMHVGRPHAGPVALKFCTDEAAARTLRKEVDLLDRVNKQGRHPGIVQLIYAHLLCETPCLEYEFVDGGDLGTLILDLHRAGEASPRRMTQLLHSVALPVGFAHRLKTPIVHRDLKPQNILATEVGGKLSLKILDFGIGGIAPKQTADGREETKSGPVDLTQSAGTCTPLYASPQQRRFGPPDPRDDVYALGVIWYQMFAGDISKETPRGGAWKKRFLDHGATAGMIHLLERCIEDDPAERPADAQVLVDELDLIISKPTEPPRDVPIAVELVKPISTTAGLTCSSSSALAACPDCGTMISLRASCCPKCGCPFNTDEAIAEAVLAALRRHSPVKDPAKNLGANALGYYVAPDILERKIGNARKSCSIPNDERVVGLIDCTFFGSASDCVVFTVNALYYHHSEPKSCAPKPGKLPYDKFRDRDFKSAWWYCVSVGPDEFFSLKSSNVRQVTLVNVLNDIKQFMLKKYRHG